MFRIVSQSGKWGDCWVVLCKFRDRESVVYRSESLYRCIDWVNGDAAKH